MEMLVCNGFDDGCQAVSVLYGDGYEVVFGEELLFQLLSFEGVVGSDEKHG
jgi:hypothetical protein